MRIFFAVGDGTGWAIDDDIALTRRAVNQLDYVRETEDIKACDIVHAPWAIGLSCYEGWQLKDKRIVCHLENDVSWFLEQPYIGDMRQRVGVWVAISKSAQERLREYGFRTDYVPYSIDTSVFKRKTEQEDEEAHDLRRRWGIPHNGYLIGSFMRDSLGVDLARPKEQKGADLFLEIVWGLKDRGLPVHVVLAGPRRHWLRGRLTERGIPYTYIGKIVEGDDNHINILDRDTLAALYRLLDLYIVTSRWEGGPRAVLEAAASGCPIISTPVGLAPDVLEPQCLYKTVDEGIELAAKAVGGSGLDASVDEQYERVLTHHTPEANIRRFGQLYENWQDIPPWHGPTGNSNRTSAKPSQGRVYAQKLKRKVSLVLKNRDKPGRGLKIGLWHRFHRPPYGGANQFMLALRGAMEDLGVKVYNNRLSGNVDVHVCNSVWFDVDRFLQFAERRPLKMLHRVDGPTAVYRGADRTVDDRIFSINQQLAAATVVQSLWSLSKLREEGYTPKNPMVIRNAVDGRLFHSRGRLPYDGQRKLRLIVTSWSDNPRKGGPVYKWLEDNLDWNRFEFTYVGRTSEEFTRLNRVPSVDSKKLGQILRQHDIYITASRDETCSNAVLEALACGLPTLYIDQGGHREFVGFGGLPFTTNEELLSQLDRLAAYYLMYQRLIAMRGIDEIARSYLELAERVAAGEH